MLSDARVSATLPCQDLERAKAWYKDKLGLGPSDESPEGATFKFSDGSSFMLFPTHGAPSGTHTQLGFEVDDFDDEVARMKAAGVTFEEYDFPGLKTEGGIAEMDGGRGAWFKDSEGNLLAITTPIQT